ncbi:MAG TPA: two-component regulator propeller domain-containing protein [Calditrichia bacterium]|nr:two-component regulator propeller domain-containing protein [Calditrichia bacterium]
MRGIGLLKLFSLIIWGLLISHLVAQATPPADLARRSHALVFERITIDQGLPTNYVNTIAQDKRGFMWFGTRNGLCRYDGREMRTYFHLPEDSTTLLANEIQFIFPDSRGRLWVAAGGLHFYDEEGDRFIRITPREYGPQAAMLGMLSSICEDSSGALWLGIMEQQLVRLDPRSRTLTPIKLYDYAGKAFGGNTIFSLFCDKVGTIWASSGGQRFFAIDPQSGTQREFPSPFRQEYMQLFQDRHGRFWSAGMATPIRRMIPSEDGFTYLPLPEASPGDFVSVFQDDALGRLWMGSPAEGLYLLNPRSGAVENYREESGNPGSLPGNMVLAMFEDRDGNMWVATNKGIAKWARWGKGFVQIRHDSEDPNSLGNAEVTGLTEDQHGNLWISTLNQGFCRYDPATGETRRFTPDNSPVATPWVLDVLAASDGSLWIAGNARHGLQVMDPSGEAVTNYRNTPEDPASLSGNVINVLFEDHNRQIWIGTPTRGLNRYNPEGDNFARYQHQQDRPGALSHNAVLTIAEDLAGRMWVGTGDGVNLWDPQNESFASFRPDSARWPPSSPFRVNAIVQDSQSRLWLGSDDGLWRADLRGDSLQNFRAVSYERKNLRDPRVFSILEDGGGHLWLQMADAIARFHPEDEKIRVFNHSDGWIQRGIYENEWRNSALKLSSGFFAFGGSEGVTLFHPDSLVEDHAPPAIVITGINLFYQPLQLTRERVAPEQAGIRAPHLLESLTLKPGGNTLSFQFAALNFTEARGNEYAYKLIGFQDSWVMSETQNTATFTNIPPGEYRFLVRGRNRDGVWSAQPAALNITILPPWWNTATAYVGYLAALALLLFLARRMIIQREKLHAELRMRDFEARKLQEVDHLKSRFFANISHEFRTPLTLILGPLTDLLPRVRDPKMSRELNLIRRNAGRLLMLINQLLDLSRLESGRMVLQVVGGDLVGFVRGITMSFASLARQKGIDLTVNDHGLGRRLLPGQAFFDPDKVEKMVVNLIANALKFTPAGGRVSVMLSLTSEQPAIAAITVSDTGPGIPAADLPHIFDRFYQSGPQNRRIAGGTGIGLALVRELCEAHHGRVTVSSNPGEGCVFRLELPVERSGFAPRELAGHHPQGEAQPGIPIAAMASLAPAETAAKAASPKSLPLVLVVDDDPDVRAYLTSILQDDCEVLQASSGVEGLAGAREQIPDVVVSDVAMPEMTGFEMSRMLKDDERTSHIPIILLTAMAGEEEKLTGLQTGADDYLVKPFNARELRLRVANLIENRRKLQQQLRKTWLQAGSRPEVPSREEAFLNKLQIILEKHLTREDFGLSLLSSELGMSERQVQRKIKGLTGESPTDIIRAARLERARMLLAQNTGNVSEIAFEVGFNNLSYFSKCFRERFGVSPSEVVRQS